MNIKEPYTATKVLSLRGTAANNTVNIFRENILFYRTKNTSKCEIPKIICPRTSFLNPSYKPKYFKFVLQKLKLSEPEAFYTVICALRSIKSYKTEGLQRLRKNSESHAENQIKYVQSFDAKKQQTVIGHILRLFFYANIYCMNMSTMFCFDIEQKMTILLANKTFGNSRVIRIDINFFH